VRAKCRSLTFSAIIKRRSGEEWNCRGNSEHYLLKEGAACKSTAVNVKVGSRVLKAVIGPFDGAVHSLVQQPKRNSRQMRGRCKECWKKKDPYRKDVPTKCSQCEVWMCEECFDNHPLHDRSGDVMMIDSL
jgi:hypothetical protein